MDKLTRAPAGAINDAQAAGTLAHILSYARRGAPGRYESGVRLQEVFAACAKQSRHGRPSRRRRGYQVNRTLVVPNPQIRRTIQDAKGFNGRRIER